VSVLDGFELSRGIRERREAARSLKGGGGKKRESFIPTLERQRGSLMSKVGPKRGTRMISVTVQLLHQGRDRPEEKIRKGAGMGIMPKPQTNS